MNKMYLTIRLFDSTETKERTSNHKGRFTNGDSRLMLSVKIDYNNHYVVRSFDHVFIKHLMLSAVHHSFKGDMSRTNQTLRIVLITNNASI